ncbi:MAG: acyltransferase family protein, partial [Thermoleophilia bacterium]
RTAGIPRMPGIDGLRALAVAGVVMFHLPAVGLVGGYLGVDLFLVISGYLITALLVAEADGTGRIHLGAFWMRRIRRLVPALVVMLAGVVVWMAVVDWSLVRRTRTMFAASLGYAANWYEAAVHFDPADPLGRSGVLEHMWSLALEEQFYLVWPLVLAGAIVLVGIRRGALLGGVVLGAAGSCVLAWALFNSGGDVTRIYYGTDTRAVALLVGIALAVALPPARVVAWRPGRANWLALEVAGVAALVAIVGVGMSLSQSGGALYRGGFLIVALMAGALLMATANPSTSTGRLFALAPLVWIGARSYGIYLWHLPVIVLLSPDHGFGVSGWWLAGLQVGVTVAVAALSYRYVEMPIRRRGFRVFVPAGRGARSVVAITGSAAALALVATVAFAPGLTPAVASPATSSPGLLVGDSSVAPAAARVAGLLGPGWAEQAADGLGPIAAARIIAGSPAAAQVVVSVGTDQAITAAGLAQVARAVPGGARLVIVLPVPAAARARVLAAAIPIVAARAHTAIADWGGVASGHPDLATAAGALLPAGAPAYARVVGTTLAALTGR